MPDLATSDIEQKPRLTRRLAALRVSLLTTTDRNTRLGIWHEISALTTWIKAIDSRPQGKTEP